MAALSTGDGFPDVVVTAITSSTALAPDAEDTWQQLLEGQSGIRRLDKPFVDEFDFPGAHRRRTARRLRPASQPRRAAPAVLHAEDVAGAWAVGCGRPPGTPEVDTRRLLVSIGLALASTRGESSTTTISRNAACVRPAHWPCRCTCRTRPPPRWGWIVEAKAGIISPMMARCLGCRGHRARRGRPSCSAKPTSRSAAASRPSIEAVPIAAFSNLGWLSTNNDDPAGACRPFDAGRDGMVFGEGGALMLIETEEHAKARGAPILAPADGRGHHVRRLRRRGAGPERRAGRRRHHPCDPAGRAGADRHRPHQRPRDRDDGRRPGRGPRDPPGTRWPHRRRCTRRRRRWATRWALRGRWSRC